MRILVLSKRQYMNKDLLDDRYGRFREIPLALATAGHAVSGICLSYRHRPSKEIMDSNAACERGVRWQSMNAGPLLLPGLMNYIRHVFRAVRQFRPHIVLACSDGIYGILGVWIGRMTNTRCIFDLYDNFESYGSTRYTGLLPFYRWAVRNADGVLCVSEPLREKVITEYQRTLPTLVVENGVRTDIFHPRDMNDCRRRLGLPTDSIIIGTAGALHKNRGIDALWRAYEKLVSEDSRIHLAIAGSRDRHTLIPSGPRVHDLGVLPPAEVPLLINALNIAVVCNLDSEFGRYCFPQKAYEILSCRKSLVAANVGAMKTLLADYPDNLFTPGDPEDLVRAVKHQIEKTRIPDIPVPTWGNLAGKIDTLMQSICDGCHAQ